MDMNSFRNNVKREAKDVTPGKVLRTAFVPQTRGLLNPIKDVFSTFVMVIVQLFAQVKLIPADHPAVLKQVTGFNAIWAVILDASTGLKFRRENIYQIIVFYGVVGMLIFGTLDFLFFLTHFSMGSAHAQTVNNTGSLFSENSQDNGPNWINTIFPYQNNGTGLPYAMQGMLVIYNSALLALGTVLALYQIVTLFMESAHHGTYGGSRYSHLYAPLRLVMGIGLLVPISYGYNSAEIIALDMAKMGSGLASNVWTAFENNLAMQGTVAQPPSNQVNELLQKLIVDETCMVAAQNQQGTSFSSGNSNQPTWLNLLSEHTDTIIHLGQDTDATAQYFTIHFDNYPGDGFCGTLTIPSQQIEVPVQSGGSAAAMTSVNYFEQAFVCPNASNGGTCTASTNNPGGSSNGQKGILADIWWIAATIYNSSQGGSGTGGAAGYDPTQNVFCTGAAAPGGGGGSPCSVITYAWTGTPLAYSGGSSTSAGTTSPYEDWENFAGVASITPTGALATTPPTPTCPNTNTAAVTTPGAVSILQGDGDTGLTELCALWQAQQEAFTDYNNNVACQYNNSTSTRPCIASVDWTQAGYLFLKVSKDAANVYSLQHPNIVVTLPDPSVMQDLSTLACPGWIAKMLGAAPFACTTGGAKIDAAVMAAIMDVTAATSYAGVDPVAFNAQSIGSGNDGGMLSRALGSIMAEMNSIMVAFNVASPPGPVFGQSIYNIMGLGNNILAVGAGMFTVSAVIGGSPFTTTLGLILAGLASTLLPVGFTLAVMVPLLPAGRFLFGIFTWILTLFEAMVTMPLVALVSIKSDGDGLFAHGNMGWLMLLQMMMRPALMVFGLLGGVVIFDTLAGFINTTVVGTWMGIQHPGSSGDVSTYLGFVGFLYFYVLTIYALANLSFGIINTIPDRVLSWMGAGGGIQTNDGTDSVAQQAAQGSGGMVNTVGNAAKGYQERVASYERQEAAANDRLLTSASSTEQRSEEYQQAQQATQSAERERQVAAGEYAQAQQRTAAAQQSLQTAEAAQQANPSVGNQQNVDNARGDLARARATQDQAAGRVDSTQQNVASATVAERAAERSARLQDRMNRNLINRDGKDG